MKRQRLTSRRAAGAHVGEQASIFSARSSRRSAPSTGQALSADVRSAMEPRFGHDFAQVRVHHDATSDHVADELGARAVADGNDIHFADGAYAPETLEGTHLLAHELAHVVQADRHGLERHSGVSDTGARNSEDVDASVSESTDAAEAEAWQAADAAIVGESANVSAAPAAALSLAPEQEKSSGSIFSTLGSLLSFPKKAGNEASFLSPVTSVLGAMGGLDKAMSSGAKGDYLGAASGLLGAGSGVTGLAGWLGKDTLGAAGNTLGGVSGLLGAASSGVDAVSDFSKGNYGKGALNTTKTLGGTLSGLAALGGFQLSSVAGMSAGSALAGGGGSGLAALGPAGAVIGAGMAGVGLGTYLSENTSVGEHSVEGIGAIDAMLTGDGERSWALETSEAMEDNWDKGNYLSAVGNGASLAGVATLGALSGIGGGIVDAGEAIGGGIADAGSWAADNLNPFEWDW